MTSFTDVLSWQEVSLRMTIAIFVGGVIGYEREHHNRPAGFRTHILVCLGAAIVTLIQDQLRIDLHGYVTEFPDVGGVIKTDLGRLGAQVVSGIGFLGAGTVMRDKRGLIGGLTTAASIWATGCLGLAIGWGFYTITIPAVVAVIIVLVVLKRLEVLLNDKRRTVKLEIHFKQNCNFNNSLLQNYNKLKEMHIKFRKIDKREDENKAYYTLVLPKLMNQFDVVTELSMCEHIKQIIV